MPRLHRLARRLASAVATALVPLAVAGPAAAATPLYQFIALPFEGFEAPFYVAMNDKLSTGGETSNTTPTSSGFVLDAHGRRVTFSLPGFQYTVVDRLNDRGDAVGGAIDQATGSAHAFVRWSDGRLVDLDAGQAGYSEARVINNARVISGYAGPIAGHRNRAFRYADGVFQWLPDLGGRGMDVAGINELGEIVGEGLDAAGHTHAVRWLDGRVDMLPGVPGGRTDYDLAKSVNASGWIAGRCTLASFQTRPCLWDPDGQVHLLPALDESESGMATGIDDAGVVVGYLVRPDNSYRAIRYVDGQPVVLDTLIVGARPSSLTEARAIDRLGRILVRTVDGSYGILWPVRAAGTTSSAAAVAPAAR